MNPLHFTAEASLAAARHFSAPWQTGVYTVTAPRAGFHEDAIAVCKTCVRLNQGNLSVCELPCYFLVL
ncbi:MAG TPA: hypothetical protein VEC06_16175 [Paucimonas sp.]|nr:hypothetical protein [Paucimonas sp.]